MKSTEIRKRINLSSRSYICLKEAVINTIDELQALNI
ncbi:DNA-directed RNA polymerase subunit alpha C-terminal domain-containing protein [Parageobacillus toebii]|nr:hypothetical protein JTI59_11390 [Parageobacillus toebii]